MPSIDQIRRWAHDRSALLHCIGKALCDVRIEEAEDKRHERIRLRFIDREVVIESRYSHEQETFLVISERK